MSAVWLFAFGYYWKIILGLKCYDNVYDNDMSQATTHYFLSDLKFFKFVELRRPFYTSSKSHQIALE